MFPFLSRLPCRESKIFDDTVVIGETRLLGAVRLHCLMLTAVFMLFLRTPRSRTSGGNPHHSGGRPLGRIVYDGESN